MFYNYLKTAFRSLKKRGLYAIINIVGLTVGITGCLLIGIYIMHEMSYDKFHDKANRICRATMEYKKGGDVNTTATTGTKVGPAFKRNFPQVEAYVRTYIGNSVVKSGEKVFDESGILFADAPFFSVFSFKLIRGNATDVLDAKNKIVLTQAAAKKYFGNEDPVNKVINAAGKEMIVSGVCEDIPMNSQLKFNFVTCFQNLFNVENETWWNANWITYFLLKQPGTTSQFESQVNNYMNSTAVKADADLSGPEYLHYHMEPLTAVHLESSLAGFEPNGSKKYIVMFSMVAMLILVIACANYANLATVMSVSRTNEIGMRKVMGATKKQLFLQFMTESLLVSMIAALLAILLSILLLPLFNNITGKSFTESILFTYQSIVLLVTVAMVACVLSAIYPSSLLLKTKIISIFKKDFTLSPSSNSLRKGLIVFQFCISFFLIVYTMVIMQQMKYMQEKNLGYNKDHVIVLPVRGKMQERLPLIKQQLLAVKNITSVTSSYDTPEFVQWGDGITANTKNGKQEISVRAMPVDLGFIKTMQMSLVAGRDFSESDLGDMDTSDNYSHFRYAYMINEALLKQLGWTAEEAIGKTINKGETGNIVGVVKDFHFNSMHQQIEPMVLFLEPGLNRNILLRTGDADAKNTIAALESKWKQILPMEPFSFQFLDNKYQKLYQSEERTATFFGMAAMLAILLACMGLFGLAAFTTIQRTKEIGIRRILGAGMMNIIVLITKNFLALILIAVLIAIPLAWWAGNTWLKDFAFRIPLQASIFIIPATFTILLAMVTVSYHAIRVGLTNPAKSLRTE